MSQTFAHLHHRLRAALLCLGVLAAGAMAEERRERKEPPMPPPPQPVPREIKVERGQDIIIPLRIYGRRNQPLTFLIRKPPRAGKLSDLKNTEAESAVVHYRSTNERTTNRDVFEYAVKSTEGVSAAVAVQIEIIDQPPDLVGPAEVFFAPRLTDTSEVQTVELVNRGGTMTEGECFVEPPWRLESPVKYRVDAGGRLFVKVIFAPEKPGEFVGELRLTSQPDRATALRGIARDALAVKPSPLRLVPELATLVRAGVFEITNHTESEQVVRINPGDRLRCESELSLAPGQTAPVMVRTQAEDASSLSAEIALEAGTYHARVAVQSDPLPAIIRPGEHSLDLGLIPAGTVGSGELLLRNVGGVSGWASVTAAAPFRTNPQRFSVAPGAVVSVPIVVDAFAVGPIEQALQVRTVGGSFEVPARVVVIAPGSAPLHLSRPTTETAAASSAPAPSTPLPMTAHDIDIEQPIDPTRIIRTISLEPTRCTLEWHVDLSPASAFVAERRELVMQGEQFSIRWRRLPAFQVERSGEHVRGTLQQLEPGHRYTVRVLPAGTDDSAIIPVLQTTFDTPKPAARRNQFSLLGALSLVAVALAGASLWRRTRRSSAPIPALKKTQRIA